MFPENETGQLTVESLSENILNLSNYASFDFSQQFNLICTLIVVNIIFKFILFFFKKK